MLQLHKLVLRNKFAQLFAAPLFLLSALFVVPQAQAQVVAPQTSTSFFQQPILTTQIAQVAPPNVIPTDATPQIFQGQQNYFNQDAQFALLKKLPPRLTFSATIETSQRFESNVFETYRKPRRDYVFRELPTVNLGWMLTKSASIYCNYFVLKDVFADHTILSKPTTQSLALGLNQNFQLGAKTSVQLDWQARELWQAKHLRQADMLPSINMSHAFSNNFVVFGSTLLQLRGKDYFVPATREVDPFYSIGALYRRGLWTLSMNHTYVTNFRFKNAIPPQGNCSWISDYEIYRPVSAKLPNVVSFIRAEPIWNWSSHRFPGLSGFDFRLYGGIRVSLSKVPTNGAIDQMRQQLIEQEKENEKTKQQNTPPSSSSLEQTPAL